MRYHSNLAFITINKVFRYARKKTTKVSKILIVTLANLVWGRKPKLAHMDEVKAFENSGLFASKLGLDLDWIYRQWADSEKIWNSGQYHKSVEIKRQLLEYVYEANRISSRRQVAPFMSPGWALAIGHLGSLGAFILGQRSGLIPSVKRWIPITTEENYSQLNKLIQDEIIPLQKKIDFLVVDHPSQWSVAEKLQIVNTNSGFLSLYEMHEQVYRTKSKKLKLELNSDYLRISRQKLRKLGLPKDAWFVGFHIRENRHALDSRLVSIENFYTAIQEVTRTGGWVIRFGTGAMKNLPNMPNVIDLCSDTPETRNLHMFILGQCKFLLTSNSGPSVLAWSLGTPVLQTNTTSIGRNILTASEGSLYLPKKYRSISRRSFSFREILNSPEAYAETNLKEKFDNGYILEENNSEEILLATKEMLSTTKNREQFQNLEIKVNKIRDEAGAVGYGKIAPSFLVQNESWFFN